MPTIVSLKPAQLENRLDADYYGPGFLANHDRLLRSGIRTSRLHSLVKLGRRAVYFSTDTMLADKAPESWVPFLTADDLGEDGCSINLESKRRVSPEFAAEYPNGLLRGNELLVKVKGPNQTTAYNSHIPSRQILVSGTIWGALVDLKSVDPHFLVAVLTSPYGGTARTRLRTNTNVEFLAPQDLLGVLLPWPHERVLQRYIGDKIRNADRLRKHASAQLASSRHLVEQHFGDFAPQPISKAHRISQDMIAPRIDAWFHNPRFLHAQGAIIKTGARLVPLSNLATVITNGGTPTDAEFTADGVPWVRGKDFHDGDISFDDVALMDRESEESISRSRLRSGDLVLSIKGTVGDVAVSDEEIEGANINQDIARIQIGNLTSAHFLALFLESSLGQTLIEQQVYGAINAFFSLENLRVFMVPNPATIAADFVVKVATQRRDAIQMRREAHRFTAAAKLLVEALIDGKVSEADLIKAQESLERGDNSLDRDLLGRLTCKGIDVPGQAPLFPSLDALYALLAQTAAATE